MPTLQCLVCGHLSNQSRCKKHRTRQARGYDQAHVKERDERISAHPVCDDCGHTAIHTGNSCGEQDKCPRCPLELHHINGLMQRRYQDPSNRPYLVLCKVCHRERTDAQAFLRRAN